LVEFLTWASEFGFIPNLTVNQGHLGKESEKLLNLLDRNIIYGLGVSYRSNFAWKIPEAILKHPNVVFHVIAGIDSFKEVEELSSKGVSKILILGEKDFGFNLGKVDLQSRKHKEWSWWVGKLFDKFKVVSFDNLALQQLDIKRFFNEESWQRFNNGEYSLYINAVEGYYSPSSRSKERKAWQGSICDYFRELHFSS
jgi:hypothetical protein